MNKPNLPKLLQTGRTFISHHTPEILTGIGIAGMITTTVLAVKATPKAVRIINEYTEEMPGDDAKVSVIEAVKLTWKCYIPAAVTCTASVACLVGATSVSARRTAALTAAYKLSETALTEYKEKVVDTIGEKKEKSIREAIAKDKIDKDPVSKKEVIVTGNGDTLCYDYWCGRYFKSTMDKLQRAINDLNRRLLLENDISLNEFYYEIGLDGVNAGDLLGWNIDDGYIELDYDSLLTDDGKPCLVVNFNKAPKYNYR